ncbi:hypothetical protein [Rahnella sp. CJA17(1/100)]|jgi:hypothetical protein|uniref:hypothetical protein n=1 Tax=Rahnella sp. CJA17(1/100) TaxID=2508951 RepID=UPI0014309BDD|nr:hypothetical protein [Rahnella sp. CJA17(1/100)]
MSFKYEMGQEVKVKVNGIDDISGVVTGRAEYSNSVNQYVITYNDGNASDWYLESDITV